MLISTYEILRFLQFLIQFEREVYVKKVIILPDPQQIDDKYNIETFPYRSNYKEVCLYILGKSDYERCPSEEDPRVAKYRLSNTRQRISCTARNPITSDFKPKHPIETGLYYGEAITYEVNKKAQSLLIEYYIKYRGSASGTFRDIYLTSIFARNS